MAFLRLESYTRQKLEHGTFSVSTYVRVDVPGIKVIVETYKHSGRLAGAIGVQINDRKPFAFSEATCNTGPNEINEIFDRLYYDIKRLQGDTV